MLSYLEKYNNLPKDLKDKISSSDIMKNIVDIEKVYDLSLAVVIMRVMVKEVSIVDLSKFFVFEYGMDGTEANKLVEELKEKVFYDVFKHLNIEESKIDAAEVAAKATASISDNSYFKDKKISTKPPVQSSNFFFSSDDEDEIKNLTKKLEGFDVEKKKNEEKKQDNVKKIDAIISKANLSFSSDEMNERFKKMIDIYLKEVRSRIDTKQTMTKLVSSGGLGVSDKIADKILGITDSISSVSVDNVSSADKKSTDNKKKELNHKSEIAGSHKKEQEEKEEDFDIMKEVNKIVSGDTEYDFSKLKTKKGSSEEILKSIKMKNEKKEIDKLKNESKKFSSKEKLVIDAIEDGTEENNLKQEKHIDEDKMVLDLSEGQKKIHNDGDVKTTKSDKSPRGEHTKSDKLLHDKQSLNIKRAAPAVVVGAPDGKVKMEDVKYVPKLMGPIEELGEMNLVNFRRLSQDPNEAAKKIEEKINFLEDDRYSKRIEGIKAWRTSPINSLYLEIGQEGIIVARGIENAIKAREKSGKDFLNVKEFNAVMSLNKKIRY
jgi:hypothetical protein